MPREGSLALAFFGRVTKVHEPAFSLCAGLKSFALKRIEVLVILAGPVNGAVNNSYRDLNGPSKMLSESLRRSFGLSLACNFSGSHSFGPGLPTAAIAST